MSSDNSETRFVDEVSDGLFHICLNEKLDDEKATRIASELKDFINTNWRGQQPYIHTDFSSRNNEIYNRFYAGKSRTELCRIYLLSYRQICTIINEEESKILDKTQIKLF